MQDDNREFLQAFVAKDSGNSAFKVVLIGIL